MKIEAVIFDMDGVLVDSEPFWKEAEKAVFKTVGIELTTEMCNLTMGYRTDEVVDYWYRHHPWSGKSPDRVRDEMLDMVENFIRRDGRAMPGVAEALDYLKEHKIKIALASSSSMRVIDTVLDALGIRSYFMAVCSAEYEPYGKPHPAVFLKAAEKLQAVPEYCLVIEDSFNGVLAAKAAKMKVIAVPDHEFSKHPGMVIADVMAGNLVDFKNKVSTFEFTASENH